MKQQTVVATLATVLLAGGLSACANTGVPVPADTPSATEQPTAEATAATPEVTDPATQDPTAAATDSPTAEPERLAFAPGATQLEVNVDLAAGETASYVLGVAEGQLMDVSFATPDTPVQLAVYGADGTVLKSGMSESAAFRGTVPSTQDYMVDVTAGADPVSTTMTVIVPERITFGEGDTSAAVEGTLDAQGTQHYVLTVEADQLMDISVEPQDGIRLVIYGADGTVLKSGMGEGASFRGTVPTTQDYLVDVSAASAASYTLNVIVPERITFGEGDTSAVVEGTLDAQGIEHYVLTVEADQLMDISVEPQDSVQLVIYGVDGTVLRSGMGEGAFFRGTVPTTQDYLVDVSGADGVSYTMNVLIPERITFGAGDTSAEFTGSLDATSSRTYVINAEAGQTMQVNVTPADAVQTIVYGVDGTVLKSGMGGGSNFSGQLPTTQDYIITVRSGPDATDYDMTVTVQ